MTPESKSPGAGDAGIKIARELQEAALLPRGHAADNHAPRLRVTLDRYRRLWVQLAGVDCQYKIDIADLDQPVFLAGRVAQLARDLQGDDGSPYAIQIASVLEKLAIGPEYTFEDWDSDVDRALAAIGGVG